MSTSLDAANLSVIRKEVECPISFEIMTDAVTLLPCGHTLSQRVVDTLRARGFPCPLDRQPIQSVSPNFTIRKIAESFDTSGHQNEERIQALTANPSDLTSPVVASVEDESTDVSCQKEPTKTGQSSIPQPSAPPLEKSVEDESTDVSCQKEPTKTGQSSIPQPSAPPLEELNEWLSPNAARILGQGKQAPHNPSTSIKQSSRQTPTCAIQPNDIQPNTHVYAPSHHFIQEGFQEVFFDACEEGNIECIEQMIQKGADVNWKKVYGNGGILTPLIIVTALRRVDCMELLLNHGANVKTKGIEASEREDLNHDWTALHAACRSAYLDGVCKLIEYGADIHAKTSYHEARYHETPLMVVCRLPRNSTIHEEEVLAIARNLLARGAKEEDLWGEDKDASHSLATVASRGRHELMGELIRCYGIDIQSFTQRDEENLCIASFDNPLVAAVCAGSIPCVQLLLENKAHANTKNGHSIALVGAYQKGDLAMIELLLAYGANPSILVDEHSHYSDPILDPSVFAKYGEKYMSWEMPLLMIASIAGRVDVTEALLRKGADISARGKIHLHGPGDVYFSMLSAVSALAPPEKQRELTLLFKSYGARESMESCCVIQ